jgi:hypothetical protein
LPSVAGHTMSAVIRHLQVVPVLMHIRCLLGPPERATATQLCNREDQLLFSRWVSAGMLWVMPMELP